MGIENFAAFIATALLFIMTPGLDTVFILNKAIGQGKRAGIFATLGINGGVLVHTLFAALGLSLVIARSAMAFAILKYVGAAYLIYLGLVKLFSSKALLTTDTIKKIPDSDRQNFLSGLITNTLNPKVALFFLAFFPQFISRYHIASPWPFIVLGLTYACIGIVWFLLVTLFSASFSKKIAAHPKADQWLSKISGLVFVLMGIKIALTKK